MLTVAMSMNFLKRLENSDREEREFVEGVKCKHDSIQIELICDIYKFWRKQKAMKLVSHCIANSPDLKCGNNQCTLPAWPSNLISDRFIPWYDHLLYQLR